MDRERSQDAKLPDPFLVRRVVLPRQQSWRWRQSDWFGSAEVRRARDTAGF